MRGCCNALKTLDGDAIAGLKIIWEALNRLEGNVSSFFCSFNDQIVGSATHIGSEQPFKAIIVVQPNRFEEFPEVLTTFAGGSLGNEVRGHIDTIISLQAHGHIQPRNPLKDGCRKGVDHAPFRREDILEVLIIIALEI